MLNHEETVYFNNLRTLRNELRTLRDTRPKYLSPNSGQSPLFGIDFSDAIEAVNEIIERFKNTVTAIKSKEYFNALEKLHE